MSALEELVAACEKEFTSESTEGLDEAGERSETDDSQVAYPSSNITFGMIRAARAELS